MITESLPNYIHALPHFIAVNYRTMFEAPDDQSGAVAGLRTYDRLLRFLTILLTSHQVHAHETDRVRIPQLARDINDLFMISDLARWKNVLETILRAYEGRATMLFMPEMHDFYWMKDENHNLHRRPEVIRAIERLDELNNDIFMRGQLPKSETDWQKQSREIKKNVHQLLNCLNFPPQYELMCITAVTPEGCVVERHVGLEICREELHTCPKDPQVDSYYLVRDRKKFLLLNPLIASLPIAPDPAIFDRLLQETTLLYLMALKGSNPIEDTTHLDEFRQLIIRTEQEKQALSSLTNLRWLDVSSACKVMTENWMSGVRKKYDARLYLQRQEVLGLLKDFLQSEKRCFVLTGKSGAGKSNFALSLADELLADARIGLLMLDATVLDITNSSLEEFLSHEFFNYWKIDSRESLLEHIDRISETRSHTLVLVLDAINEHSEPQKLLRQINQLLYKPYPWLKIMLTSRPEAWRRMCHGTNLAANQFYQPETLMIDSDRPDLSACNLAPFDTDEQQKAYGQYQEKYGLMSSLDSLSAGTQQLLREPLQLWLVANTYNNRSIPPNLTSRDLIPGYIDALKVNSTRAGGLRDEDIEFLQKKIVPLLVQDGKFENKVTGQMLLDKGGDLLFNQVFSEGYYSSHEKVSENTQRLADAQIVVRRTEHQATELDFKYERFLDHFLGEFLYSERIKPAANQVNECSKLINSIQTYPFIYGAVEYALYRAGLEMPKTIEALSMTDSLYSVQLLSSVLIDLAQTRPGGVKETIQHIIQDGLRSSERANAQQRAQAVEIALRVAATIKDQEAFVQVLTCSTPYLRDVGVKFGFYGGKQNPAFLLSVLKSVKHKVLTGSLPVSFAGLQSMIRSAVLMLLEGYHDTQSSVPYLAQTELDKNAQILVSEVRDMLISLGDRPLLRAARWLLQTALAQMGMRLVTSVTTSYNAGQKVSFSVNNGYEFSKFFKLQPSSPIRQQAFRAFRYLDRTVPREADFEDMVLNLYRTKDRVCECLADYLADVYGILDPPAGKRLLERAFNELTELGNNQLLFAVARWYSIIDRQDMVSDDDLQTMKKYNLGWLDFERHSYGIVTHSDRVYQYHPLIYYGALWTRAHPNAPVDLIDELIRKALETKDEDLLVHIIDSFGDVRAPWRDFRPTLRLLRPILDMEGTVREHLITSLGNLRGFYPEQVEHFLVEADVKRDLANAIRRESYKKPASELFLRFSQFLDDVLVKAPMDFLHRLLGMIGKALHANSFGQMLSGVMKDMLDTFIYSKG